VSKKGLFPLRNNKTVPANEDGSPVRKQSTSLPPIKQKSPVPEPSVPWIKPVLSANGDRSSSAGRGMCIFFFLIGSFSLRVGKNIKNEIIFGIFTKWVIKILERAWELDQTLDVIQLADVKNGGGGASLGSNTLVTSLNRPKLQNGH